MHPAEKNNLVLLRQRIPVGLRHGRQLLEKTNGDVGQAAQLFRDEVTATLSENTGVNYATVKKHLEEHQYDITRALKSIDAVRFTLTERILRQYQRKLDALEKIADAVSVELNMTRDALRPWLNFEDLARQPTEVYCVLSVVEWLHYASWEGFGHALHFHLDVVVAQIERQLCLPEVSESLHTARIVYDREYKEHRVCTQKGLQDLSAEFDCYRPMLIETLYAYVVKHITRFP